MSTYSGNISLKVNRAVGAGTTVAANCYVVATYIATAIAISGLNNNNERFLAPPPVSLYYGPGQSVPGTFTTSFWECASGLAAFTPALITWTIQSGVEFINTP